MSNKCLITRLRSVVNDENLPILGGIKLYGNTVENNPNNWILLSAHEPNKVVAKLMNGTITASSGNAVIISANSVYLSSDSSKGFQASDEGGVVSILVEDKYNLKSIRRVALGDSLKALMYTKVELLELIIDNTYTNQDILAEVNISELNEFVYKDSLTKAHFTAYYQRKDKLVGDIAALKNFNNLESVRFAQGNIVGNIAGLADLTKLTSLEFVQCSGIAGNIVNLGKLTKLVNLSITPSTTVNGTIEAFVQAQRNNGRASEPTGIVIKEGLGAVTFNGEQIPFVGGSSRTLTWTNSSITFDEVTITA